jgi:hypothetical protein
VEDEKRILAIYFNELVIVDSEVWRKLINKYRPRGNGWRGIEERKKKEGKIRQAGNGQMER